jgi:hypothetical protein
MTIKDSSQENITPWNIKKIYEILRRRSTPGYKSGSKFDDCWIKLANLLKQKNICPVIYLESLFEKWGGIPFPNQLYGERSMRIFDEYSVKGESIGKMEFDNEIRILNNYLNNPKNKEKDLDDVLLLEFLPIKSYTRVLLCSDEIFNKLKNKHVGIAVAELKSNPSVNKYIKDNYVSRYIRLFPQRISKSIDSEYNTLPEPSSSPKGRENVPIRRRSSNT